MSNKLIYLEFTPNTERNLKVLAKKYRHIRKDIQPVIERLESGDIIGDQIPGTGYTVFKVRVRNTDIRKGKSSGYRIIYNLKTNEYIVIVTIYSKLNQGNISVKEINRIIRDFGDNNGI